MSVPITGCAEGESQDMSCSDVSVGVLHTGFSVSRQMGISLLFTCNFAIKAGERYGKGLHGTHRVVVVQRENVIGYSAELHHNVVH